MHWTYSLEETLAMLALIKDDKDNEPSPLSHLKNESDVVTMEELGKFITWYSHKLADWIVKNHSEIPKMWRSK